MPLFSVIVTVYNTEKYLKKCFESIINQSFKDLELIIINNDSTDNSEKIIMEYMEKDNRIKYWKKENEGVSSSRNLGISNASGKYFIFIDSDDYIDIDLLYNLKTYLDEEVDLIKYKLIKVDTNYNELERITGPVFNTISGEQAFNELFSTDILIDSPCIYAFNTQFYKDNGFEFTLNREHEDFGLIPLIIAKSKSMISTEIYGYYYVQSSNSITRNNEYTRTLKKMEDSLVHYDNMIEQIKEYNIYEKTKENIKLYYTNAIILKLETLNKKDRKIYIKKIKEKEMIKNIKINNIRQLIKKILLKTNINWYLKVR